MSAIDPRLAGDPEHRAVEAEVEAIVQSLGYSVTAKVLEGSYDEDGRPDERMKASLRKWDEERILEDVMKFDLELLLADVAPELLEQEKAKSQEMAALFATWDDRDLEINLFQDEMCLGYGLWEDEEDYRRAMIRYLLLAKEWLKRLGYEVS